MKRRGTFARLTLNRIAGIVVCILAAGPVTIFVDIAIKVTRGRRLTGTAATIWNEPLSEILAVFAMVDAVMSPMIAAIALGMYVLARLSKDGFLIATLSGAFFGYVAITMTFLTLMGKAPGLEFDSPSNTRNIATMFFTTFTISALYWLVSIRRERSWRRIDMQDELALRAME
jgi:hypothetical protein